MWLKWCTSLGSDTTCIMQVGCALQGAWEPATTRVEGDFTSDVGSSNAPGSWSGNGVPLWIQPREVRCQQTGLGTLARQSQARHNGGQQRHRCGRWQTRAGERASGSAGVHKRENKKTHGREYTRVNFREFAVKATAENSQVSRTVPFCQRQNIISCRITR